MVVLQGDAILVRVIGKDLPCVGYIQVSRHYIHLETLPYVKPYICRRGVEIAWASAKFGSA